MQMNGKKFLKEYVSANTQRNRSCMLYLHATSDDGSKVIIRYFTFIQINDVVLVSNKYILNEVNIFAAASGLVQ